MMVMELKVLFKSLMVIQRIVGGLCNVDRGTNVPIKIMVLASGQILANNFP